MGATTTIGYVVSKEYNRIRTCAKNEWKKYHTSTFDEDIFHDTIIKCMETLDKKELQENEIMAYITSSFKTNILRDGQYARNVKKNGDDPLQMVIPISDKPKIDIDIVKDDVTKNFTEQESEMFNDWLDGMTIKEINEKYGSKKGRYIIDKIKEYIKSNYTLEDFR
jgi:hypothetical protein